MSFFDEFEDAIRTYPYGVSGRVMLTINDPVKVTGTPGAVNVNEIWKFTVTVKNHGQLNMDNVSVRLWGHGSEVTFSAGNTVNRWSWSDSIITTVIPSVPAHGSGTTAYYYFKAPSTAQPITIRARVHAWDANLDYLLKDSSSTLSAPSTENDRELYIVVYP